MLSHNHIFISFSLFFNKEFSYLKLSKYWEIPTFSFSSSSTVLLYTYIWFLWMLWTYGFSKEQEKLKKKRLKMLNWSINLLVFWYLSAIELHRQKNSINNTVLCEFFVELQIKMIVLPSPPPPKQKFLTMPLIMSLPIKKKKKSCLLAKICVFTMVRWKTYH